MWVFVQTWKHSERSQQQKQVRMDWEEGRQAEWNIIICNRIWITLMGTYIFVSSIWRYKACDYAWSHYWGGLWCYPSPGWWSFVNKLSNCVVCCMAGNIRAHCSQVSSEEGWDSQRKIGTASVSWPEEIKPNLWETWKCRDMCPHQIWDFSLVISICKYKQVDRRRKLMLSLAWLGWVSWDNVAHHVACSGSLTSLGYFR